jgi:hypothetical protein
MGFLLYLLRRCGFGGKWCWIGHCFSSVHVSVLVNNTSIRFFSSSFGFGQGNPLSPRLFVFVMEALGMISIVVSGRLLDGFSVGNTSFSHLLFADDSLIFYVALPAHLRHMWSLFLCFEAASGLKVNLAKIKLVPVGNVCQRGSLARVLGCGVFSLSVKYSGLLLGDSYKAKHIWGSVIDSGKSVGQLEYDVFVQEW